MMSPTLEKLLTGTEAVKSVVTVNLQSAGSEDTCMLSLARVKEQGFCDAAIAWLTSSALSEESIAME